VIVFLAILAAPFAIARAAARLEELRGLRPYSLAAGIVQLGAVAAYAAFYGETGGGIAQRLLALTFMAWIAMFAAQTLRRR
jgi:hypothetical protein